MFTGLIEEIGTIQKVVSIPGGRRLFVSAQHILEGIKADDSISVNGVCLTATEVTSNGFWVDAVGETLTKSTISEVTPQTAVNLERALRMSDRLGGHILQGHVNGIGVITKIVKRGENYLVEVDLPENTGKYVIAEGSIAIDGISLTIAQLLGVKIGISVIPHTWENTILKMKKTGDKVNIEVDVIAKYVEKLMGNRVSKEEDRFSDEWFKKIGY